jgi:hypothetical protein
MPSRTFTRLPLAFLMVSIAALAAGDVRVANQATRSWFLKVVHPGAAAPSFHFLLVNGWSGLREPTDTMELKPGLTVSLPLSAFPQWQAVYLKLVDDEGHSQGGLLVARTGKDTGVMDRYTTGAGTPENRDKACSVAGLTATIVADHWAAAESAAQSKHSPGSPGKAAVPPTPYLGATPSPKTPPSKASPTPPPKS